MDGPGVGRISLQSGNECLLPQSFETCTKADRSNVGLDVHSVNDLPMTEGKPDARYFARQKQPK